MAHLCVIRLLLKHWMTHLGVITEQAKLRVSFLALQNWNSNFRFRGPVARWKLSLGIPSQSPVCPHNEPLSGTMLVLSSLTKVAMHICTHGGIHSGDGQQRQSILWGDSCRITFSFASHTLVNFTPIFLNRTGRLLLCFCCVYTAANKWNYLQTSWVSTEILNSGT